MKAAFPTWENRIAPVFDVAAQLKIVEYSPQGITSESFVSMDTQLPLQRVRTLADLGVETLICGAISRQLQYLVSGYGIVVIPFVSGEVREIIEVLMTEDPDLSSFAMPGCCGRRRGACLVSHDTNQEFRETDTMIKRGTGGGPGRSGPGRGQGQKGSRSGRMGGPAAAGTGGECVCERCGYREPHRQGRPCNKTVCPRCNVQLIRT